MANQRATIFKTTNVTAGWNPVLQVVYRRQDDDENRNCNWAQHFQCHCWLEFVFTSGLQRAGSNTTNVTAGWNPVLQVVYRRQNDDGK